MALCANACPHPSKSQTNGLSPVCVRLWMVKMLFRANTCPHPAKSHANGLSPVCVRLCLAKSVLRANALPHPPQSQMCLCGDRSRSLSIAAGGCEYTAKWCAGLFYMGHTTKTSRRTHQAMDATFTHRIAAMSALTSSQNFCAFVVNSIAFREVRGTSPAGKNSLCMSAVQAPQSSTDTDAAILRGGAHLQWVQAVQAMV